MSDTELDDLKLLVKVLVRGYDWAASSRELTIFAPGRYLVLTMAAGLPVVDKRTREGLRNLRDQRP